MKTYAEVHELLLKERGRASEQLCVCGKPAQEWSYQYNGNPELYLGPGKKLPYCEDVYVGYEARCKKCHRVFDLANDPTLRNVMGENGRSTGNLATEASQKAARANLVVARAAITDEVRRRTGKALGRLRVERLKADPEYAAQVSEQSRKNASTKRKCLQCGLVSHPPGIGTHQKASGHKGYTDISTQR